MKVNIGMTNAAVLPEPVEPSGEQIHQVSEDCSTYQSQRCQ